MKPEVTTMHDYLATLPADRLEAISEVRYLVNRKLPRGYRESVSNGTIVWYVPLEACPTENGQPLTYAALTNEKKYMALYLMTVYSDPKAEAAFRAAFAKVGKRLDMGKSCVRFRRLADLHMPAIGRAIEACSMEEFISRARAVRERMALTTASGAPTRAKSKVVRERGALTTASEAPTHAKLKAVRECGALTTASGAPTRAKAKATSKQAPRRA